MKITYALALTGMLAFSGSAFAGSSTTTNTNTIAKPAAAATVDTAKPAAKPAVADTQKQAISKKCSADADAKGLHGKERKKFRDQCKTAAMKKS